MKKLIVLLTLAIGFIATNTAAQNRHREHTEQTAYKQCGHRNYHHHYYRQPSYMVINGKVYFDGTIIPDAQAGSFIVLKHGYAKDNYNTYYYGKRID